MKLGKHSSFLAVMSEDPKGKVGEHRLFKAKAYFRILVLLIMALHDGESL